jgi:hypothetical protein
MFSLPLARGAALGLAALAMPLSSLAQTLNEQFWTTDGTVEDVVYVDNSFTQTIYVGGSFTKVGPVTIGAQLLDFTGAAIPPLLRVDGVVMAIAADGFGGWYLGGSFTSVQGEARSNLAQLDAGGGVTSWAPDPNGAVRTIVVGSGEFYVGGEFTTIAGTPAAAPPHSLRPEISSRGTPRRTGPSTPWLLTWAPASSTSAAHSSTSGEPPVAASRRWTPPRRS